MQLNSSSFNLLYLLKNICDVFVKFWIGNWILTTLLNIVSNVFLGTKAPLANVDVCLIDSNVCFNITFRKNKNLNQFFSISSKIS